MQQFPGLPGTPHTWYWSLRHWQRLAQACHAEGVSSASLSPARPDPLTSMALSLGQGCSGLTPGGAQGTVRGPGSWPLAQPPGALQEQRRCFQGEYLGAVLPFLGPVLVSSCDATLRPSLPTWGVLTSLCWTPRASAPRPSQRFSDSQESLGSNIPGPEARGRAVGEEGWPERGGGGRLPVCPLQVGVAPWAAVPGAGESSGVCSRRPVWDTARRLPCTKGQWVWTWRGRPGW